MLATVILLAVAPALVIFALGVVARIVSRQPVRSLVVQYTRARGASVLHDALLVEADRRAAAAVLVDLAVSRRIRILASEGRREPIGVELRAGGVFTDDEFAVLEAIFGPEHTNERLRRFSSDRRALAARLKGVVRDAHYALARAGLVAAARVTWPGTTLTVLAYLGMLVEALFLVASLGAGDWPALIATLVALAVTIATIIVTPASWRRFLPPAREPREHLDGLRRYLHLAEADRLRALQSPAGAQLVPITQPTDAAAPVAASSTLAASDALARFHLHERLLPYAVLFGVEQAWITALRLDLATLDRTKRDTLADLADGTAEAAELAVHLDALSVLVAHVPRLAMNLGALVDAKGAVIDLADSVGDLFRIIE
ncbi:DUF2207 domain-containing protein [Agromyces aureus]|uniref:DUF2207 domain-containing protein n=1 Tax=Agromyces aureus TaxID=453304 RepID=A0A191WIZ5_9MICO|nr:DUF2207 domain-containing protein [Agromyces aureus]ANJ28148.1 hypothetical protein ATC03_16975 [Agromyces aureus]